MLQKVATIRIFEQVVQQIRELIVSGELHPGDKLPPEQELEKQLSVSRSSIREALRVLEVEGLVEVRRGSGTYVTSSTSKDKTRGEIANWLGQREELLLQVLEVRESLEGLNAALCAQNATEEEVAEIKTLLANMEKKVAEKLPGSEVDLDKMVDLDSKFHLAISRASGNNVSNEITSQIIPAFQEGNKAVIYVSDQADATLKDHLAILTAIQARNPKSAEEAMRKHIARVRNLMESIILNENAMGVEKENFTPIQELKH
jgi:GntR family transcriptional regulator, transcriptional repressor for pyruvate dehydrogenase complex